MRFRTLLLLLATLGSFAFSWLLWKDLLRDPPLTMRPIQPTPRERQLGFLLTPQTSALAEHRLPAPLVLNATFARAIDDLRNATGHNIFVNGKTLETVGVTRDTPVSLDVSGQPFADALNLLLSGVNAPDSALGFYTEDEFDSAASRIRHPRLAAPAKPATAAGKPVITITTREDFLSDTEIQIYDVRDLLAPLRAPSPAPARDADRLVRHITTSIDPESWQVEPPKIRFISGQLVITQTPINHIDIATLLYDFQRTRRLKAFALRAAWLTVSMLLLVAFMHTTVRYLFLRSRRGKNLCPNCHYDLRATPDRCPECGTTVPPSVGLPSSLYARERAG